MQASRREVGIATVSQAATPGLAGFVLTRAGVSEESGLDPEARAQAISRAPTRRAGARRPAGPECASTGAEAPPMDLLGVRHAGRELLDAEALDPRELRVNLREMAMLNRLPGGVASSARAIRRLAGRNGAAPLVLDVGTGAGDLPRRLLRDQGARWRVVAIDLRAEVLDLARRWLPDHPRLTVLQADARRLPLADATVDVAHASLLIHHLDAAEAVEALSEMRRVARRGVVVNDLRRGGFAFGVTAATVLALARGRYTRHDGVVSALRAYTLDELDELAASAGLRPVWRSPAWLPRVTTIYR